MQRSAGLVADAQLAGEPRTLREREDESEDVVEQGGHDAAVAAHRRPFMCGPQGDRGDHFITIAADVGIETVRRR